MGTDSLLNGRFEIVGEIGRGSQAVTYRAKDHETGDDVALKELDFRRIEEWKAQELFEREGKTLQSLSHRAIPRYVDAFAVEDEDSIRLFLAQEYVEGPTLAEELAGGKRWSQADIIADAKHLLDALAYLHDCMPPVIHRDIKPSNIIRRTDGGVSLVDFGAVQNALPRTVGGSTVIGTPGYMPMEQLMGRALPATDLYALGATLIHLLSNVEPSALPVDRNRMVFKDRVRCGAALQRVLERMTEPTVEDRYPDAEAVLRDLTVSFDADTLQPRSAPTDAFDRPSSAWDSLTEPGLTNDEPSKIERVEFHRRTMNFPGWTSVVPHDDGTFVLDFETRDADEHDLRIQLTDRVDGLVLLGWVDQAKKAHTASVARWTMTGAAVVLVMICYSYAPNLVPLALVGAMAILIAKILAPQEEELPDIELRIARDELQLTRKDDFRTRTSTRKAHWFVAQKSELLLRTDREVPVFELSRNNAYQATWFQKHLAARCAEIAAEEVELQFHSAEATEQVEDHVVRERKR